MGRPIRLYRDGGKPQLAKRRRMKRLLLLGHSAEEIAPLMGYANARSVRVMIDRWGFREIYRRSYIFRARTGNLAKMRK
jgi:hypothetical protein